ncbi:uncharacterized protein ATC70_005874 [Mucor velutinosus]|uniref:Uncharacterized protein n=1 Tax=Mucor velutinosus TaxID=708070 RepID=A0AAN7DBS5_9FUNG|nr:hypothetical protein ATC70_005874 [Mucor velutinosus]
MSPKKFNHKAVNQKAPGETNTVSAAPVGTDAQGSIAATLMEIGYPIITASQDVINGGSSASSSSVGIIHRDLPRTSVSTDGINGDASGNFSVPAEIHGSQTGSVSASSNIYGNTAASVGDANVDNASTTFYHIPVPQALDVHKDQSIIPSNLGVLRNQLEMAERTYELVFGKTGSTLVPNETPYFQWRGHFFKKRRAVFATPNDCLDHFELVLQAHRLSIHDNWERIVPVEYIHYDPHSDSSSSYQI